MTCLFFIISCSPSCFNTFRVFLTDFFRITNARIVPADPHNDLGLSLLSSSSGDRICWPQPRQPLLRRLVSPKSPRHPPSPSCCCLRPEDMQSTDSVKGQCISCPASLPAVAWWTLPALQLYIRVISPIFNLTCISYTPGLLFSDYLWFLFRETFYCLIWVAADFKE
jgi:hypothetical protein